MQQTEDTHSVLSELTYAYGQPSISGVLRHQPEDFMVQEQLNHTASGEGEHLYVHIEKCNQNTDWVAGQLARFCSVKRQAVSYAGMKDRRAVTRQWFSIQLPGKQAPDWSQWAVEGVRILDQARNLRKLKRGSITANSFRIVLRDLQGDTAKVKSKLEAITTQGVPNYFGEQRFGHQGKNIEKALALFSGTLKMCRAERSIYLSAARSWLFNQVLSARVNAESWGQVQEGDVLILAGSNSVFAASKEETSELQQRHNQHDLHIAGPLPGKGNGLFTDESLVLNEQIYSSNKALYDGLIAQGMELDYRPLRLMPQNLECELENKQLTLSFSLPAGAYATAVIRELVNT